jgi:hypothetical protein
MFAEVLAVLNQVTDAAFAVYELAPQEISALRKRFAGWRTELLRACP